MPPSTRHHPKEGRPILKAVRQAVSEFSENTSIHGVRYIAEHGRRWVERFVWIVTELVCLTAAVYMLLYLLYKFQGNPTMTRVETYSHEVAGVPFPAVTVCNVNRIFRSRAHRLVNRLKLPEAYPVAREDVMRLLPLLGQLLSSAEMGVDMAGRAHLNTLLKYNNLTPEAVLEEVGQPCSELIERCSWEGRQVECRNMFSRTMTFMGFCCSFNSIFDFSVAVQAAGAASRKPLKTPFFGYPLGLTVLLNPDTHDYYSGPFASGGVLCAVHDRDEMATERSQQAMVPVERETMVQVLPSIRNSTSALRDVTPQRRRCLLEDENPLSETEDYSYERCNMECEAGKIWAACKCRPLNFPRILGPRGAHCTLDKLPCLAKFSESEHDAMVRGQIRGDAVPSHPADAEKESEKISQSCGCMAQCNSVNYGLETTTADFKASAYVRRNFYRNLNATGRCLLHVYFDSQTSVLYINDLVVNTVQLMSSFGGIFSLFLGCSFMSAVELLYFFTVRLWLLVRGAGPLPALTTAPARPLAGSFINTPAVMGGSGHFEIRAGDHDTRVWGSEKPTRPRAF